MYLDLCWRIPERRTILCINFLEKLQKVNQPELRYNLVLLTSTSAVSEHEVVEPCVHSR